MHLGRAPDHAGELTVLPRHPSLIWGKEWGRDGKGRGGKGQPLNKILATDVITVAIIACAT